MMPMHSASSASTSAISATPSTLAVSSMWNHANAVISASAPNMYTYAGRLIPNQASMLVDAK